MRTSRTARYLGIALAIVFLAAPSARINTAFATHKQISEKVAHYACVGTCSGSSLKGVDVDVKNDVIYAVDAGNLELVQIDGTNPSISNTYPLPNCFDPRRPAVAHDLTSGDTKVYVGCETNHSVLSFDFPTALGPPSGAPVRISLKYTAGGVTKTFEPKTEKANDRLGIVYVVGDSVSYVGAFATDPAFEIDVKTDTITHVNPNLGNPPPNTCGSNGIQPCGNFVNHQGLNDVAIGPADSKSPNQVFWFNEDDHRVWRTNKDLGSVSFSNPVPHPCDSDAPSHGAVTDGETATENVSGQATIMATASEAGTPCTGTGESPNGSETGALYTGHDTVISPTVTMYATLPRFQAGAIVEADGQFLLSNLNSDTLGTDCMVSCIQIRSADEGLKDTVPIKDSQTDIAWNSDEEEAWATLSGDTGSNITYFSTS